MNRTFSATTNEFAPHGPHPNGYNPLLTGKGRIRLDGFSSSFGLYPLMDFTVTKTKFQGDTNETLIFVRNGTGSWGVDDPTFQQFAGKYKFGPNDVTAENGAADLAIPLPMIRISNGVPEPGAIALLAIGGLALIRRR